MGVYTLEEIAERIAPVAKRHNIPAMYLFGSYARGTAAENSDIDILVDTSGTSLTNLFELGGLYCDLEDALEKSIDLVTVDAIEQKSQMPSDDDFKQNVLNERVCVYAIG